MQLVGIGVDIVEVRRLAEVRYPERVASFFLRPEELSVLKHSRDQVQFLASRFAAKEAVIKAFPGILHYHDFVVTTEGLKPSVRFINSQYASYAVLLSIAHENRYAISYATVCR